MKEILRNALLQALSAEALEDALAEVVVESIDYYAIARELFKSLTVEEISDTVLDIISLL